MLERFWKKSKLSYLLLVVMTVFSACNASKNIVEDSPKPEWVKSRPIQSVYYIGISSASKKGLSPASYTATAKQNALSDLASEISVTIESTSVLNSISTDNQFSQQFVNDIKTSNALQIEGYELVATWEDSENYWVYYQLSKSGYQEWKMQKKEEAISNAKNKYLQGDNLLQQKLHFSAFQFYADALSILTPYLNESALCQIEGQSVDLGNAIYNSMAEFVNNSKFDIPLANISVKKGVEIDNDLFCFFLKDALGNEMANIPVQVDFSGIGLLKNSEKTGNNGEFCCSFQKIKSENSFETLSFLIDLTALSRITSNHLVRSIIKNIPISETAIRIEINKPILQLTGNDSLLINHFMDLLNNDFEFVGNHDFVLDVSSEIKQKEQFNNQYYIDLECVISMSNSFGKNVYRRRIKEEYSGKNWKEASQNGYSEIMKMLERSVKREIINSIN